MLTTLSRMLTPNGRISMPQMIYPFMSKVGGLDSPVKLNNKYESMHDLLQTKLFVLKKLHQKEVVTQEEKLAFEANVGDEFPMHEELKFVKYILKVTID